MLDDSGGRGPRIENFCVVTSLCSFLWSNKEYLMKDNIGRDSQTELQRIAIFSCLLGNSLFGSPSIPLLLSRQKLFGRHVSRDALRMYEKAVDDNDWPCHYHCSAEALKGLHEEFLPGSILQMSSCISLARNPFSLSASSSS